MNFGSTGTDANAGTIGPGLLKFSVSGKPNLQSPGGVNFNVTSSTTPVNVTAPFTLSTTVTGPSGLGDARVFSGASGYSVNPNQTLVNVILATNAGYTSAATFGESVVSSSNIAPCEAGVAACTQAITGTFPGSSTQSWALQVPASLTSGVGTASFTASITGTGGTYSTQVSSPSITVVPPYTFGTPSASPVALVQGGSAALTIPVTFASGFVASGGLSAVVAGAPTGITISTSSAATTGSPSIGLSVAAAATAATGSLSGTTITGSAVAGTSYTGGAGVGLPLNVSAPFTLTAVSNSGPTSVTFNGGIIAVLQATVSYSSGFSGSVLLLVPNQGVNNLTFSCGWAGAPCGILNSPSVRFGASGQNVSYWDAVNTSHGITAGSDTITFSACVVPDTATSSCSGLPTVTSSVSATVNRPTLSITASSGGFNSSTFSLATTGSATVAVSAASGIILTVYATNASVIGTCNGLGSTYAQASIAAGGNAQMTLSGSPTTLAFVGLYNDPVFGDTATVCLTSSGLSYSSHFGAPAVGVQRRGRNNTPSGSGTREHMTVTANNEACTAVRLSSASQSSCSGRSDFEVQPVITAAGTLNISMNASNGGLLDMGSASSLPDPSLVTGGTLTPQAAFQQGHVYLVKSGSNISLVRVVRVNSTINPKLGATVSGSGARNPAVRHNGGSLAGLMGDIRDQRTADQVLRSARIMIDLEWIPVQNQTVGSGGTN